MAGLSNRTATARVEDVILTAIDLALRERRFTVASIAALRAVGSVGASGLQSIGEDVLAVVTGTGLYRWSVSSSTADNGTTVIKPTDAGATGRWLKQANPGGTVTTLKLRGADITAITSGYLQHVALYEGQFDESEAFTRILARRPAVLIDFMDRAKTRQGTNAGALSLCDFRFQLWIVDFSARGNLTASRGSTVAAEAARSPGAYALAGDLEDLLDGTTGEQLGETGIGFVRTGGLAILEKQLTDRRVILSLEFGVWATTGRTDEDAEDLGGIDIQPQIAINRPVVDLDPDNVIVSGLTIPLASFSLNGTPANGSALIEGTTVAVTGTVHTFTAWRDTYRDLNPSGTFTYVAVQVGADAPDVTTGALRIGRTRTDNASITDDVLLAPTLRDDGPDIDVP